MGVPVPGEGRSTNSSFVFLANQTRWEFIPSDEELISSDREPVHLCILSSYSISPMPALTVVSSKPSPWTYALYKFIVMGPLGLDPIHLRGPSPKIATL